MASVSVQKRDSARDKAEGRPATWRVMWREPSGRQRSRTFKRKTDADAFAAKLEHELRDRTYLDPSAAQLTVGTFIESWLKTQPQLSPATAARYAGVVKNQINPTWEHVQLGRVTHADVQAWVAELAKGGLAARSVIKAHMLLSRVLDAAVKAKRIPANPARGADLPKAAPESKRFLSAGEVAHLAACCEEEAAGTGLIVLTLAYTGLRIGELAALRVRDFDSSKRRLRVARSVTDVDGHMVFGPTKTHANREVPVARSVAKQIEDHITATGKAGDDLLFTAPGGGVLRANNFRRRAFDAGAKVAGLDGLTPHDLRHAAASLAVAGGADVKAVQRMLGHASAAMTLDTYSTLFEDGLDAVAERMDKLATKAAKARSTETKVPKARAPKPDSDPTSDDLPRETPGKRDRS